MQCQLTDKALSVLSKAKGGFYSVGDRVEVDKFEVIDNYPMYPGVIKALYKEKTRTGIREFADVLLDNGELLKREMTMFFS